MYYFFLGNTPELSLSELTSLLGSKPTLISTGIASYATTTDLSTLFPKLGGTRKVAQLTTSCNSNDVVSHISEIIQSLPNKNIALTDYANQSLSKSTLHDLKRSITRPIRLVSMETSEHELTMLAHQHVAEINLIPHEQGVAIALTTWIFDAEDWIKRDRSKPYRDIKRGMLPPKLARILVNLAAQGKEGLTISDPFCGTGTVLSEAALVGCSTLYGSDTNPTAVTGTQANLDWLSSAYNLPIIASKTAEVDATHLDQFIPSTDIIATEPYMGPLLDDRNPLPLAKIQDIAKGLDKLYRGCFKSWAKILPVGGRVVMTIPSFAVYGRVIPTISIDTISSLGYNYISSLGYGKPGATVIRNITILEKK